MDSGGAECPEPSPTPDGRSGRPAALVVVAGPGVSGSLARLLAREGYVLALSWLSAASAASAGSAGASGASGASD